MDIKKITAAYFSPTGNVEKVVRCVAERIQRVLVKGDDAEDNRCGSPELVYFDFLPPEVRGQSGPGARGNSGSATGEQAVQQPMEFGEGDLLVIGVPVYAGRVPNRILPFVQNGFKAAELSAIKTSGGQISDGQATADQASAVKTAADQTSAGQGSPICVPIVCFGNRSHDDALAELAMEMRNSGFVVPAGAAIVTEHSFCPEIGTDRPDENDMEQIKDFATKVGEQILAIESGNAQQDDGKTVHVLKSEECACNSEPVMPGSTPPGPYYTPLKEDGTPAYFLKTAMPVTDEEKCDRCMKCAHRCPMGSIDKTDPAAIKGICIKCQACVSVCPKDAKTFTDEEFLSHKRALAANYVRRAESVFILP